MLMRLLSEHEHLGTKSTSESTSPLAEGVAEIINRHHPVTDFVDAIFECVPLTVALTVHLLQSYDVHDIRGLYPREQCESIR